MRTTLKVTNRTHFNTKVLRSLITLVHKWAAKQDLRRPLDRLRVTVEYKRRGGGVHGWGGVDSGWMMLRVKKAGVSFNLLAWLIRHELMHNFGYHHHQFTDVNVPPEVFASLVAQYGPNVPVKVVQPKPQRDLVQERYTRVLAAERRWQTKLKRAQTMLRKVKAQRKGYERRMQLAAARKVKGETQ